MCTEHHYWHHDYVRLAWDSGFCFDLHKAKTNLDWSSLGIVDVEQIVRDRDVAIVEKHLSTVTNYYLEPEHTKILDPTFVKVFRLGQLSVQYLQFCKRYLDNTVVLLKKELAKHREENTQLKGYTEELKSEIAELKKKIKTLKDSLQNQALPFENSGAYKCATCSKMFLTEEYLIAHIKRRHENVTPFQSETDKLQLEIKELKERLNTTEKFIQSDHNLKSEPVPDSNKTAEDKEARVDMLIQKFDELKQSIERELATLRSEKCNDRYERWLEIVFRRLDNSKRELQNEKYGEVDVLSTGDGYCESKKADNVTQTRVVVCKDSEVMTEVAGDDDKTEAKSPVLELDIKKLQEDLYANTENQLGQIQDALEQKLTGGLEQIQTQINTFCEKFNNIEGERGVFIEQRECIPPANETILIGRMDSVELNQTGKPSGEEVQPQPAPRITMSLPLVKEKRPVTAKRSAAKLETKPFVRTPIELTSEGCSYSSMSEDEKILFPPKSSKPRIKDAAIIAGHEDRRAFVKVETLYDKNVNVITKQGDNDESDEERSIEAPIKPSTSSLGRRSISSLKQAGKDEQLLAGLKNELEEMLYLKLKDVGVSPTWKRLPHKSYVKAMSIVQHQTELTAKKYPNYRKIKGKLLKKVNTTLKKTSKKIAVVKTSPLDKKTKPRIAVRRSKPPPEKKTAHDTDDESSSNNTYVTAQKEVQQAVSIEPAEKKLSAVRKKVFFDLEESSSVSKDKQQAGRAQEPYRPKNSKPDKIPMLTMNVLQQERSESEGTTESITSSILDCTKPQSSHKNEKDDIVKVAIETSDWEISDIS